MSLGPCPKLQRSNPDHPDWSIQRSRSRAVYRSLATRSHPVRPAFCLEARLGCVSMLALRFLGVLVLAVCTFAGAFCLAYAAILCGWIVYADYAGALGSTDGGAAAVAFFWAPLAALGAASLSAGCLVRLNLSQMRRKGHRAPEMFKPAPPDEIEPEIDRRLGEHAALLKQLQALANPIPDAHRPAGAINRAPHFHSEQDQRRVA